MPKKTIVFIVTLFLICLSSCQSLDDIQEIESEVFFDNEKETIYPSLGLNEIIYHISTNRPESYYPVHKLGNILFFLHDLTKTGREEIFVLLVQTDDAYEANYHVLNQDIRLYETPVKTNQYAVAMYRQKKDSIVLEKLLPLSNEACLHDVSFHKLPNGIELYVSFLRQQGIVHYTRTLNASLKSQELIFREQSGNYIDRNRRDSQSKIYYWVQIAEEGFGKETYVREYAWNGDEYALMHSFPLIRRLNAYLQEIKKALESKDIMHIEKVLQQNDVGNNVHQYFVPHYDYSFIIDDIQDVVFPIVKGNPFFNNRDYGFALDFNIFLNNGDVLICQVIIGFNIDQLGDQAFYVKKSL